MDIVISHASAIRLIREARETPGATLERTALTRVPRKPRRTRLTARKLSSLSPFSADLGREGARLDLLVPDATSRYQLRGVASHVLSVPLPQGQLLRARHDSQGASVLVTAPSLCVAQMAGVLLERVREGRLERWQAVVKLVELCAELCGTYSRNPQSPKTSPCAFGLAPVCSAAEIRSGLELLHDIDGLSLAREAARHVFDGSASPMETLHRMMLCLPGELGGLVLPKPQMNCPIDAKGPVAPLLSHAGMRPDLSWVELKIAVEHDGEEWHDMKGRRVLDARRIQDYQTLGWVVLPATFEDVRRQSSYNAFALRLCGLMDARGLAGTSTRVRRLLQDEEFLARQALLLAMLLPPIERYGDAGALVA